ncbi:MAG: MerR family transcriptional regulator [Sciscionella sp.]
MSSPLTCPAPLLAAPTWVSVATASKREQLTHAIRGAYTFCGLTVRTTRWAQNEALPRCLVCMAVPEGHGTHLDVRALGLSIRQVEYWIEQGWLRPDVAAPGSGRRRTFPPFEVHVAALMLTLTQAGLSPDAAQRAARDGGRLSQTVRVYVEGPR